MQLNFNHFQSERGSEMLLPEYISYSLQPGLAALGLTIASKMAKEMQSLGGLQQREVENYE
jgi:hypothetical protein